MYTARASKQGLRKFLQVNKKLYFLSLIVFIVGLVVGVVLVASEQMDEVVYTSIEVGLREIIINDYSSFSLFFSGILRVVVPLIIIFIMSLSRYTGFLGMVYFGYQAMLLGASTASLVLSSGMAGILNALFVVFPINLINFFLIASGFVIFYKRQQLAKFQKLSLGHSLKIFLPKLGYLLIGILFSAAVYGFIYPLLLRSMIIVNA